MLDKVASNVIKNATRFSTIFAHSSGSLPAGVAVVRLSGKESAKVLTRITRRTRAFEPRRLVLSKIYSIEEEDVKKPDAEDVLDHAMVVWMPGPDTFTGEDTVELHLHGSRAVVDAVCRNLEKMDNVEHAKPGEFIKRAFFNGKYSLSQVESINDLIYAETESQRRLAIKQSDSGKYLEPLRGKLIDLLASLEASIDFAEDVDNQEMANLQTSAEAIFNQLKRYQRGAARGSLIRQGVRVALIGKTNAGKSSLINRLAEKDVAIVSDISGTTRDSLETKLDLESVPVYVVDTAGIRDTVDVLEKEGISRSIIRAKEAQIVVIVVDINDPEWSDDVDKILDKLDATVKDKVVYCLNKQDLIQNKEQQQILKELDSDSRFHQKSVVFASTIQEDGLDELIKLLKKSVKDLCQSEGSEVTLSRQRHIKLLDEAVEELEAFLDSLGFDKALAAQCLRNCADSIGEISGTIVNEQEEDMSGKDEVKMAKKMMRKEMANILTKVPELEVKKQTERVQQMILRHKVFQDSKRLSIFVSTAGEIMTDGIIREALKMDKQVFIPRFEKGVKTMEMLRLKSVKEFDDLKPTLWDIRQFETQNDADRYQQTGPLDLILLPLVAATKSGKRLGHGMGYYDRFITEHVKYFQKKPYLMGVALKEQIVDDVPTEESDVTIDTVVHSEEN